MNGTTKEPYYEWDRTQAENEKRAADQIIARTPFPQPDAKTLPFPKFCEYWNALIQLPVAKYGRLYVRRWFPALLPEEIEDKRTGLTREGYPNEKKYSAEDGPLNEQKLLGDIGVGDYTIRLNDTRRSWDQSTILHCEKLCTIRDWKTYPPDMDYKRLDWDDEANRVFIRWAQSNGKLKRPEEEDEKEMVQNTVVESALGEARAERARTDQLLQSNVARLEQEKKELQAQLAAKQEVKPEAPKQPPSELLTVVTSVASLAKSLQPEKDTSLSEYLKLQQEREITERAREREDRELARTAAAVERKRADDLQAQILADLKEATKPAITAPKTEQTRLDMLKNAVEEQSLLKQIAGGRGSAAAQPEEEKPSSIDKWLDAAPILAPVVQGIVSGLFQTIHFALTTWSDVAYNNAAKNGGEARVPAHVKPENRPEPGKPLAPQPPPPTPEQVLQNQRLILMLTALEQAAELIANAIDDGDSGAMFAETIIKIKRRPAYDMIRALGEKQPGVYDFEVFKANLGSLLQHPGRGPETAKLWEKVGPLPTFGQFLLDFFNYDEIVKQQQKEEEEEGGLSR